MGRKGNGVSMSHAGSQVKVLEKDQVVTVLQDLLKGIEQGQTEPYHVEAEYFLSDVMLPDGSYGKMQNGVVKLSLVFRPQ